MKLIDKDALIAEIERRINGINLDTIDDWRYRLQWEHDIEVMKNIISLINTIEVKETGYKWDAGKKELIKIEQNHAWSEEDNIMKQNCHQMLALLRPNSSELIKDIIDNCHHWLKSIKDRVQPQPNQGWSEKDEENLNWVINVWNRLRRGGDAQTTPNQMEMLENWLKSLKPNHWKPSEQELAALRTAISVLKEERNFPLAAGHLQDILNHFESKEIRNDWKPSEEQMQVFETAIRCCTIPWEKLITLYNDLKKL